MSRFVSAGTTEDEQTSQAASASPSTAAREEAWATAQRQIDAARQQTSSQQRPRPGEQEGGKSLYETLQANKAAKQEAFEEAARLKNQFRSLDDDEVEFLDSVLESTRAKDAEVKKETRDQLEAFRRQQEEAERGVGAHDGGAEEGRDEGQGQSGGGGGEWSVGPRKRKKGREREGLLGGVKVRRTSTAENAESAKTATVDSAGPGKAESKSSGAAASPPAVGEENIKAAETATKPTPAATMAQPKPRPPSPPAKPTPTGLGLAAYSSDEDD